MLALIGNVLREFRQEIQGHARGDRGVGHGGGKVCRGVHRDGAKGHGGDPPAVEGAGGFHSLSVPKSGVYCPYIVRSRFLIPRGDP
jgi:hypothetical protein